MIKYLNPVACLLFVVLAAVAIYGSVKKKEDQCVLLEKNRHLDYVSYAIIAIGTVLRFVRLGLIPYGCQQDEASIGYDAFTLAQFGIDRNGYRWPVYPITWGSGGGSPLMVYLTAATTKIFGKSMWSLRFTPALTGALTLLIFYLILKKLRGSFTALIGTAFLAVCPWHFMQSRWALDSNTTPFWIGLATLLLIMAFESRKTWQFMLSAAIYAVCLAAYGSATVVVPIYLLAICIYGIRKGRLEIRQMILSMAAFLVVFSPLLLFYLVNYLDLPEINTAFFSVPKLTAARSVFYSPAQAISNIPQTIKYLLLTLTVGWDSMEIPCNYIPGFATLYAFTFPITLLGFLSCAADSLKKEFAPGTVFLYQFIVALLFTFFIEPDINRMTLIFMPLIYFFTVGLRRAAAIWKIGAAAGGLIILAAACLFFRSYFGHSYRELSAETFMPGYGEACVYAESVYEDGQTIYSTYAHLSAPSMLALYYTGTDVYEFMDTVHYRDENAEFRIATSFGHYVFGLPDDIMDEKYKDDILILYRDEKENFDPEQYDFTDFGDFSVAVPHGN